MASINELGVSDPGRGGRSPTRPNRPGGLRAAATAVLRAPALPPLCLAAALLAGLLIGIEPVGGDPDRLYRPIKAELARALAEGRLPFWSDRLGLGFPMVAESHAAAFYPPNWVLYRFLSVPAAYRLSMFLHYLLLVAATFAYARRLGISAPGAALSAFSFGFCGFQAIHSSHETIYHALAYLPLCLYLAEWFLDGGRGMAIVALAVAYAMQLTVGHFQVQSWTAGLVVLVGLCRLGRAPRLAGRVLGLVAALAWGASIAAVQLVTTWELTRFVGFDRRAFADLAFYGFPPAHWAELFAPTLFRGIPGGPEAGYWYSQMTTGYEACFYVGTIPLALAIVGLCARRGASRGRAFWSVISALTFLTAVMPMLWLEGYARVVSIPGMGLFRAPGRFLAIASLGLCLTAGRGIDCASPSRTMIGLGLGGLLAAVAGWWGFVWCARPDHLSQLGGDRLLMSLALAAACWAIAIGLIVARARGVTGPGVLLAATAVELGGLYYTSTTDWGWSIAVPAASPMLSALANEDGVGRVAGPLHDLPLRFGVAPLYPQTGFRPPPPHLLIERLKQREVAAAPEGRRLLRRFGATHGVWDGPVVGDDVETVLTCPDPALDRLIHKPPGAPPHPSWRLVRYKGVTPPARAATRVRYAADEAALVAGISYDLDPAVVWYQAEDRPPDEQAPRAKAARVVSWDGREAVVEHDGPCDLVVNRTYYPGWTASIGGGPERPVGRAELGVQVVHLPGSGTHRARFAYRPTNLHAASWVSVGALALAVGALALGLSRFAASKRGPSSGEAR